MSIFSIVRGIYPGKGSDINQLIKRIEKYLDKDLKFSMREFQQLQLLREDVLKLEEIVMHPGKGQLTISEHYKAHAREIEKYSERIERRLNVWLKGLESLVIAESRNESRIITEQDEQYFSSWIDKINICKNNLIRILSKGGELHKLINEEPPDWREVKSKINEALGDNKNPGIRTLVALFQQLGQIHKRLGETTYVAQEKYQKRLQLLQKLNFPVEKEPQLADFLIKHWNGTIEMLKAASPYRIYISFLFGVGLPAAKSIINGRTWPGMVEMAKAVGTHTGELFKDDLLPLEDMINGKPWFWPGLVEVVKATNGCSSFFQYSLPAVEGMINERTWPMIVKGFVEMENALYRGEWPLLENGLGGIKGIINEGTWLTIVKGFVDIAEAAGSATRELFEYSWNAVNVKSIINERTWPMIVKGFVEMAKAAGTDAKHLFRYGLPAVKSIITSYEDWQIIVKFMVSIAPNKQKLELFSHLSKVPPSAMRAFSDFILLMMDKQPARVLNIISYVRVLAELNASIRDKILQFAKIAGTFRLNLGEYPSERIKRNIRNTYIFLAQQTQKKDIERKLSELDKDIQKLSNPTAGIRKATIDKISTVIAPLIVEYLEHVTLSKLEEAWHSFTGIGINKDIEKRYYDDLLFALMVAKQNNRREAKLFLEQVSLGNFYPEKSLPNCFPYDQQKSMAFIAAMQSQGVNMAPWLYGFEKTLPVQSKAQAEHQAELIEQNTNEVLQLFRKLGIQTTKENMFEAFKKIKSHPNKAVVQDIKLHLQTIKSFEGGVKAIKSIAEAKVYIELNPLKVLQMGEKVSGSCLALNGGHVDTTITNAIDVNKRVVWAEHRGQILGRVLLAMNNEGEILRYRTYYAFTGIDLENTFDAFVKELAKACHTKTSTRENVLLILASDWYAGSSPES